MSTNFKCGIKHGRTHCKIGYCSKWGWCSFSDYSKKFQQPLYSENTCKNGSLVKPVDLGSTCRMAGANGYCGIDSRKKHCATGFCNRTGRCTAGPNRFDQLEYSGGTCVNGIKVKPPLRKFYYDSCNFTKNSRCGKGHGNTICNSGYCDYWGYCTKSSSAEHKKWQQKEFAASACKPSLVKPVDLGSTCRMAGANGYCGIDSRKKHCATGFCNRTGRCTAGPNRFDQLEYSGGTCVNGIKVKPPLRKFYYDSCNFTKNSRCGKGHGNTICNSGYCDYWGYCTKSSSAEHKKWQQKEFAASTCKPSLVKPVDLGSACRMAGANRQCGIDSRWKHCATGFCNRTGWCEAGPRRFDQLEYSEGTCVNGIKVKPNFGKFYYDSCNFTRNNRCGKGHGNTICNSGYCDYWGYCTKSSSAEHKKWQQKEFAASTCKPSLVNLSWQSERQARRINLFSS